LDSKKKERRTEQRGVIEDGGRKEIEDGYVSEFVRNLQEFGFSPEDPKRASKEVRPKGEPSCFELVALELRDKALEGCPARTGEEDRRRQLACLWSLQT
jgi:hypothetical protein